LYIVIVLTQYYHRVKDLLKKYKDIIFFLLVMIFIHLTIHANISNG